MRADVLIEDSPDYKASKVATIMKPHMVEHVTFRVSPSHKGGIDISGRAISFDGRIDAGIDGHIQSAACTHYEGMEEEMIKMFAQLVRKVGRESREYHKKMSPEQLEEEVLRSIRSSQVERAVEHIKAIR